MMRSCAVYRGLQLVSVINRSVGATPSFWGTGAMTPTPVGRTYSRLRNSYWYQPSAVSTKMWSPIRRSLRPLNGCPYAIRCAATAKLPTAPGIDVVT
jgi:hypothetical protein